MGAERYFCWALGIFILTVIADEIVSDTEDGVLTLQEVVVLLSYVGSITTMVTSGAIHRLGGIVGRPAPSSVG